MEKVRKLNVLVILAVGLMLTGKSSADDTGLLCALACVPQLVPTKVCNCIHDCFSGSPAPSQQYSENDVGEQDADGLGYFGLMVTGKSSAAFKDCYMKCFFTCMIEPSQTLCSCTTNCLKDCIFQQSQNDVRERDSDGLGYCKLGCAISMCSGFSTRHAPSQ
ncbi:thionin-like protein 2 [Striga asiatica]|uniref:Thionin-like protein 2 n=1 Tax=Striga asiatica TaxID=4170 RepID=A0A5A7QSR2_STRAF|nr:thionin-like protein 2 [Striga asiatica]